MYESTLRPPIGLGLKALSVLVGVSALVVVVLSFVGGSPSPFLIGFEIVAVVAAAFGWMVGKGRFADGPALALACVAGAVGVGALLGYIGAGGTLMGHGLKPYLIGRALAAVGFASAAAWFVLRHRPAMSIPSLIRGVAFSAAFVVLVRVAYGMRSTIMAMHPLVVVFILTVVSLLALAFLAAGVHFVIRAFEMGLFAENGRRLDHGDAASNRPVV